MAGILEDRCGRQPPQIPTQRLIGRLGAVVVGLHDERVGLPEPLDYRLAEAAQRRAAQQPLELTGPRAPQSDDAGQPLEQPPLGLRHRGQLGARDRRERPRARQRAEACARLVGDSQERSAEPPARDRVQSDGEVCLGMPRVQAGQRAVVAVEQCPPPRAPSGIGVAVDVLVGVHAAGDPPQREVGLRQLRQALELALDRPLLRDAQPQVVDVVQAIQRSRLAAPTDEHVRAREAQPDLHGRRPDPGHGRIRTRSPAARSSRSTINPPERP